MGKCSCRQRGDVVDVKQPPSSTASSTTPRSSGIEGASYRKREAELAKEETITRRRKKRS
jgi:hypothetical protein